MNKWPISTKAQVFYGSRHEFMLSSKFESLLKDRLLRFWAILQYTVLLKIN